MPVANFILPGGPAHIPDTLRFYEHTDFKLTMAGVGAQTRISGISPKDLAKQLDEQKKQLVRMAGERAVTLGVRGQFTGKCLEALGVYNYRIIGCPSLYVHYDGIWPAIPKPSLRKPIISVTRNQRCEETDPMQSKIIRLGMKENAEWIIQMPTEVPECVMAGQIPSLDEVRKCYPAEKWQDEAICKYFAQNTHWFFEYDTWQRYLKEGEFAFSFGSRFHGIIASLHAGIPSLLLVHDSRTLELAETTGISYITPEQFEKVGCMEGLIPYCDYSKFYDRYAVLARNYAEFLEENGIPHRLFMSMNALQMEGYAG